MAITSSTFEYAPAPESRAIVDIRPPDEVQPLLEIVAARPDVTLAELKDQLQTGLSRSTLCVALQKLRLTLKKKS